MMMKVVSGRGGLCVLQILEREEPIGEVLLTLKHSWRHFRESLRLRLRLTCLSDIREVHT